MTEWILPIIGNSSIFSSMKNSDNGSIVEGHRGLEEIWLTNLQQGYITQHLRIYDYFMLLLNWQNVILSYIFK